MKRTLLIIFMTLFAAAFLCGCKKEAQMVEDTVSTVVSDVKDAIMGDDKENNGTVTDGDGYIGNENRETTDKRNTTAQSRDRSIM